MKNSRTILVYGIHKVNADVIRKSTMLNQIQIDFPLLVIIILLAATLAAFLYGLFPYPFGLIILGFALVARILQLQSRT